MDVFKLAFETMIVGLLAFLWLGVAIDLVLPTFFARIVPAAAVIEKNQTLISIGVLSLAYCVGSAILPISSQLVNDEHWPLSEDAIRCTVFIQQDERLQAGGNAEVKCNRETIHKRLKTRRVAKAGRAKPLADDRRLARFVEAHQSSPSLLLCEALGILKKSREDRTKEDAADVP